MSQVHDLMLVQGKLDLHVYWVAPLGTPALFLDVASSRGGKVRAAISGRDDAQEDHGNACLASIS